VAAVQRGDRGLSRIGQRHQGGERPGGSLPLRGASREAAPWFLEQQLGGHPASRPREGRRCRHGEQGGQRQETGCRLGDRSTGQGCRAALSGEAHRLGRWGGPPPTPARGLESSVPVYRGVDVVGLNSSEMPSSGVFSAWSRRARERLASQAGCWASKGGEAGFPAPRFRLGVVVVDKTRRPVRGGARQVAALLAAPGKGAGGALLGQPPGHCTGLARSTRRPKRARRARAEERAQRTWGA